MRKPNLFLLGTSKAGTTSLYYYLSQHPDVLMCDPKEPPFFSVEYERGLDYYWRTYFRRYAGQRVAGDAAPHHLFLHYAAKRIAETAPEARLVVTCRNPVERAVSAYWHNVSRGIEDRPFEELVERNIERLRTGPRFETEEEARHFAEVASKEGNRGVQRAFGFYVEPGHYSEHIELYRSLFGPDRLKIVFFDDLKRDPQGTVDDILAFLGLDPLPLRDASPQNEATGRLGATVFSVLGGLPGVGRLPPTLRTKAKQRIGRLLRGKDTKPAISPRALRRLADHYRPYNRRLAELTGRDLSSWNTA